MEYRGQHSSARPAPRTRAKRPAPGPAGQAGAMLALQRACGNRAVSALMLQRQPLDITKAKSVTTPGGVFLRFPAGKHHTNQTDRPRIMHPRSAMKKYTGAANNGSEVIHPAVATDLDRLMQAMRAEGTRLGDESLKQAVVASAWRPSEESEGVNYLSALRKTIRQNAAKLPNAFPESLVAMAKSELGTVGSAKHNEFRAALAAAPGWDQAQADFLIKKTSGYKAPRGGSTHHSGVVVDIDFPYVDKDGKVDTHAMHRERNADAFLSAAGQWLNQHAPGLGFDTYDTEKEIWHMEWRNWRGTAVDPSAPAPATGGAQAPAHASAEPPDALQDADLSKALSTWASPLAHLLPWW